MNRYIVKPNHDLRFTHHRASFRFANLMFQRDYFLFHLAHFHASDCATRFVKQINDRAWQTADENDEKAKRANEDSLCFRYSTKAAEHDLQDFFPKSNSCETDGQRGDRAFRQAMLLPQFAQLAPELL